MGSKKVACKKSASDHLLRFASSCLLVCIFNQIRNGQGSKGQAKDSFHQKCLEDGLSDSTICVYGICIYTVMTDQGNCFITYLFYNHIILKSKGIFQVV